MSSTTARRRIEVIRNIESAIEALLNDLDSKNPCLRLGSARPRPVISNSTRDTKRLAVVMRVLDLVHQALLSDTVITKRDIYYRDPELFESQAVVDRVVDHLAASLGTTRAALNVAAAAKGLVIGDLTIRRRDNQVLVCDNREPQLIPMLDHDDVLEVEALDWILVIEKEATFSGLASAALTHEPGLGRGIMITGKGYPDLATRAFLRRLATSHSRDRTAPAVLALMDHDPDGIAIMSTYKHGSVALNHENADLVIPQLEWIGVKRQDLVQTSRDFVPGEDSEKERGLLRLSERDRLKATAMLERGVCTEYGLEPTWRQELQAMLMTNTKAEIQLLEGRPGGLMAWLPGRLGAMYGAKEDFVDLTGDL